MVDKLKIKILHHANEDTHKTWDIYVYNMYACMYVCMYVYRESFRLRINLEFVSAITACCLTVNTNVFSSIIVRLAPGAGAFQGILQYRNNSNSKSKWKNLCSDKWDIHSADVVCRQLGMGYALQVETVQRINQLLQVHFACTGNEVSLSNCENVEVKCRRRNKAVSITCSGQNG